jgi:glycerol transport system ATP-binding protein
MSLILNDIDLHDGVEDLAVGITAEFKQGMNILLGPTLAGKTTLMRIIAGLQKPDAGQISLNGTDLLKVDVRKRSVAFVYQQFINYPAFSVFDNIASPLKVAGDKMSKTEIRERVEEVAELLGLSPFLKRRPSALSGGQQQRVAIARALARKSDIVLLDEPLANLDYKLREQLREELQNIFEGSDSVVLYSTAEPGEAMYFSAPTFVMHEGQIIQKGTAAEIYGKPENLFSAKAISDPPINLISAVHKDGEVAFADTQFDRVGKGDAFAKTSNFLLGLQPHDLFPEPFSGSASLSGEVQLAEVTGNSTFVHIQLTSGEEVVMEIEGAHPINPGNKLTAHFDPKRIYGFDPTNNATISYPQRSVVNG